MSRLAISEQTKRKLWAESMGKCMNPDCEQELFLEKWDIIELAHIVPYADTKDNSFENLIVLCPNCHTNFDKNHKYSKDQVKDWKQRRQEDRDEFFSQEFQSFDELEEKIKPLLIRNKIIYENYYLEEKKELWEKFEPQILINNHKIKWLLNKNMHLLQTNKEWESNQTIINELIQHIDEFEVTRGNTEKERAVLFPEKVNSIFWVEPIKEQEIMLQSLASLECFIQKLKQNGGLIGVDLISQDPKITYTKNKTTIELYLKDTPRLRQEYYNYQCFRESWVRIKWFLLLLQYMKNNNIEFWRQDETQLSVIQVNSRSLIFLSKYLLSRADIIALFPKPQTIIVNINTWDTISKEAYEFAKEIEIDLRNQKDFFTKIRTI